MALALECIRQGRQPVGGRLWIAKKIGRAEDETVAVCDPPVTDTAGVGPGQVVILVEGDILVLRVVVRAGLEVLRLAAVEVAIGEVEAGDHAERLAGKPGSFRFGHALDQPGDVERIADDAGGADQVALAVGSLASSRSQALAWGTKGGGAGGRERARRGAGWSRRSRRGRRGLPRRRPCARRPRRTRSGIRGRRPSGRGQGIRSWRPSWPVVREARARTKGDGSASAGASAGPGVDAAGTQGSRRDGSQRRMGGMFKDL